MSRSEPMPDPDPAAPDVVERLRARTATGNDMRYDCGDEAADVIERLRAEVAKLQRIDSDHADICDQMIAIGAEFGALVGDDFPQWFHDRLARLRAENERYQAMVQRATEAVATIGERENALRAEVERRQAEVAEARAQADQNWFMARDVQQGAAPSARRRAVGEVITGDGLTVRVPSACPFCGADQRPPMSDFPPAVIGVYECGTAKNFRPDGQCDQSRDCLEAAPAFATARTLELVAAWLHATAAKQVLPSDGEFRKAAEYLAQQVERGEPLRWAEERGRG